MMRIAIAESYLRLTAFGTIIRVWPRPFCSQTRRSAGLHASNESSLTGKGCYLDPIPGVHMFMKLRGSPRRAQFIVLFSALACSLAPTPLHALSDTTDPAAACAAKNRIGSVVVDHITFVTYSSNAGTCLQAVAAGKVVYRSAVDSMQSFTLGQPASTDGNYFAVPNGADVTGRGHPDMIVSAYSGGAHCCTTHYVFELEPTFKLLATLNDADDDFAHFARDPKDRRYDYYTADWTFAYWPTCFACSPSELVILRWADDAKGGGFHLAFGKMQKPAPTTAAWNKQLSAIRGVVNHGNADSIGQTLWQNVLDLIYSGHSDFAWKLVDAAGPKAQQKPFPALSDFCSLLRQSPYWPDLLPTLKDPPPACAGGPLPAGK
jgi:hypothetical protein